MLGRLLRALRRLLAPVGRILAVPARLLAHLIMLPFDLAFLFFDVFVVNLKKTGWFASDCRGKDSYVGGVCPPARKYTNRFLFRLVCPEMGCGPRGVGSVCRAGEGPRFHLIRGAIIAVLLTGSAFGGYWAGGKLWPGPAERLPEGERLKRMLARRVQGGEELLAAGNYKDARSQFLGALRLEPQSRELRYRVAICSARLGETDEALAYFMAAAQGEQAYAPALDEAALLLYQRGDIGMAGAFASRAIEQGGADAETYAVMADRHVWLRDLESAAEHLDIAEQKGAEGEALALARAHLLMSQDELGRAEELLDSVPEDSPFMPLAALYRLDVLWKAGKGAEAVQQLQAVQERFAHLPWLALILVDSQFRAGRREEAVAGAMRMAETFAELPTARLDLARLLSGNREDGLALRVLEGCYAAKQTRVAANVLAGNIYLRRGLPRLAAEHSEQALIAGPSELPALMLAARLAISRGNAEEAARHLREATRVAPDNAEAWALLATAQKALKNLDAALEALAKACELRPSSGAYHLEYALTLIGAGRDEQAREELLKAAELIPRPASPYTHLGVLAQRAGDHKMAREYYVKAVQVAPERATIAANNLAELLLTQEEDIPLALAFAYSAHVRSLGTPLGPAAADTLAKALIKANYPSSAVGLARIAAEVQPASPDRQYRLGVAEAAAGNVEQAIAALNRVSELDPDSEAAAMARDLAEILKQQDEGAATPEPASSPKEAQGS
jgi:tetratricopeptide (TPR) repeat protein